MGDNLSSPTIRIVGRARLDVWKFGKSCWLESENGPIIEKSCLGHTVWFKLEVYGMLEGEKITFKLFEWNKIQKNTPLKINDCEGIVGTVKNRAVTIPLDLPLDWGKIVEDNSGYLMLYWEATYRGVTKRAPSETKDFLRVNHYDNEIYFCSSEAMSEFPDIFTTNGELLTNLVVSTTSETTNAAADLMVHEMTVAKLEQGFLVANNGSVYRRSPNSLRSRTYFAYTPDKKITVSQAQNFGFRQSDAIITTKGINQYEYFSQRANVTCSIKLLRKIGNVGMALDGINLLKTMLSIANGKYEKPSLFSIPIPNFALGCLTAVFDHYMMNYENEIERAIERRFMEELENAIHDSFDKVREKVQSNLGKKYKFDIVYSVSDEGIARIYSGEINKISDMKQLEYKGSNCHVLYRIVERENRPTVCGIVAIFII